MKPRTRATRAPKVLAPAARALVPALARDADADADANANANDARFFGHLGATQHAALQALLQAMARGTARGLLRPPGRDARRALSGREGLRPPRRRRILAASRTSGDRP